MNKTDLYKLIDTLPASKVPVVRAYLEALHAGANSEKKGEALNTLLDSASYDDEAYSEQELLTIDERIREAQGGQSIPFDQVKAEHGLI